jgi:hypothetical protein
MSFFNKLKQAVGVGTLKVQLRVPERLEWQNGRIQGELVLTASGPVKVKRMTVKLTEIYTSGRDEDRSTKKSEIGIVEDSTLFEMGANQTRTVKFNLPFKTQGFSGNALSQRQDAMGAVGKLFAKINDDKVEHELIARVDVDGAPLDASDRLKVQFV